MADLNPQPLPPRSIKVHLPPNLLYDLDSFQKVQRSVLNQVGCPGCTSGIQIHWQIFEQFVVNDVGDIHPIAGSGQLSL